MPLMPFTEPSHIDKLLSGAKRQTTRQPRKKPLEVGDVLYCYYKPRQKPGCKNCIRQPCAHENDIRRPFIKDCSEWRNYFGEAEIVEIEHFWRVQHWPEVRGNESAYYSSFGTRPEKFMENWAKADGFADLQEAHKWFVKSTKNHQWMFQDYDVIFFRPRWL